LGVLARASPFRLGDLAQPIARRKESVPDLGLAENLRKPSGPIWRQKSNLPESLLGVHIALGHEEVAHAVGVDLRNALRVAVDIHGADKRGAEALRLPAAKERRTANIPNAESRMARAANAPRSKRANGIVFRPRHVPSVSLRELSL